MRLLATLAALLLTMTAAHAEPYAFAGFGWARAKLDTAPPIDDRGTYFSAGVGYGFNRYLALEGSYVQASEFAGAQSATSGGLITATGQSAEMKGFGLAAIGSAPLGERFAVFAKAGVTRIVTNVTTRTSVSTDAGAASVILSTNESETNDTAWSPSIGVGAWFNAAPNFRIRALAEQVNGSAPLERLRTFSLQAVVLF